MPKKFNVSVDISIKLKQAFPNDIMHPNFGGQSAEELIANFDKGQKISFECAFMSNDKETSYDAGFKKTDLKGIPNLTKDFVLSYSGEVTITASDYAAGIVEDEGQAEVRFQHVSIDQIILEQDTEAEDKSVKIGLAK
jgi:hypothetical protein